jgi:hypothetical protein
MHSLAPLAFGGFPMCCFLVSDLGYLWVVLMGRETYVPL